MSTSYGANSYDAERRIASICRGSEAESVQQQLVATLSDPQQAYKLWLFWAQWRAMGREALSRETEMSLWVVSNRLRQLREAGVPVLSWSAERDLIARGRFHSE